MQTLIFAIERSIVLTFMGLIFIIVSKLILGKYLHKKLPNLWIRMGLYSFVGVMGSTLDYSNYFAEEFVHLPLQILMVFLLTSFLWMYFLVLVSLVISSKIKGNNVPRSE